MGLSYCQFPLDCLEEVIFEQIQFFKGDSSFFSDILVLVVNVIVELGGQEYYAEDNSKNEK